MGKSLKVQEPNLDVLLSLEFRVLGFRIWDLGFRV